MTTPTAPEAPATRVLHLAGRDAWARALETGSYTGSTRGMDLAEVGFVHMSTAAQLPGVIAFLYGDVAASDVVLLVVDLPCLAAAGVDVRWELVEGAATAFPHAYGPIPVTAVVATADLATDDAGHLVLPDLTGAGVLTAPPNT